MNTAASTYFAAAVPNGSYRGFLAVDDSGTVIGGGGIVISPWPGVPGQSLPRRAMILDMYVERDHRRHDGKPDLAFLNYGYYYKQPAATVLLHK